MKTLFIDTHLFDIHIYLFAKNQIVSEKHIVDEKHNSEFLLPAIKEVCNGYDYDRIVVVNGPGSFTGVRLGVTVAKTLAYTQNKEIIPISYFDLMAMSYGDEKYVFGINDGNGYFIGEYYKSKKTKDFYYINNSEYANLVQHKNIITDVTIDFQKVLLKLSTLNGINPHAVNPIYVKLIGVENDKRS